MKTTGVLILFLILTSCAGSKKQEKGQSLKSIDLVIENVKIFNSRTNETSENKTIFINDDVIIEILEAGSQKYTSKNLIHGNGKLVTPGFIDTHVHLSQIFGDGNETAPEFISKDDSYRQILAEQYLQYGTTTILDLGQPEKWLDVSIQWQNTPSNQYPNIYNAGGALISDFDWEPNMNHSEIKGPTHAKEKIQGYSDKGIKHIKLYSYLNEEDLKFVLDAAKEHNISVFGHMDRGEVNVSRAMELGIKNLEHFFTLINSVLTTSEHWIKLNNKYDLGRIRSVNEWTAAMLLYFDYVDSSPELKKRLDNLINTLVENKVSISTTVSVFASIAEQSDFFSSFTTFPLRSSPYFPSYVDIDKNTLKNAFQIMMKYLKKANEKGVKIRIGTDCRYGGKAMLNELTLLAKAGIPVGDVLQIATWNGAEAMSIENQYGAIEKNKKADLIIFEENPFDDYNNFLSKKTIIKSGRIFQPKKSVSEEMLDRVINNGVKKSIEWYKSIESNASYSTSHKIQINEVAQGLFKINRVKDAVSILRFCSNEFTSTKYNDLSEVQLNNIGYHYLELKNVLGAIDVFKLNVELFPGSWNAYDSLGEAYLVNGNKKLAKKNYKASLKINPENTYAIEALKRMGE